MLWYLRWTLFKRKYTRIDCRGFKKSSLNDMTERWFRRFWWWIHQSGASVCTSRKVQATRRASGKWCRRVHMERRRQDREILSRAKRRERDEENTCSKRVHAFQGFRQREEYDGGDVSLNIWRGCDLKRTRVTALGRRLNNAKSTYSPAVCLSSFRVSLFVTFSFRSFHSSSFSLSLFLAIVSLYLCVFF